MEKYDDVSNLTYLNDASVLWNLKTRYQAKLIYVRMRHANGFFFWRKKRYPCSSTFKYITTSWLRAASHPLTGLAPLGPLKKVS